VLPATDWGSVVLFTVLLGGFVALTSGFATWAFRGYQRTL
jgi:hypothetical protein